MKELEIVKKLCEIMGVNYSHYDNHRMSKDYFSFEISAIPKIVVYSSTYGHWQFSVLEDMSIITPVSKYYQTLFEMEAFLKERRGIDAKNEKLMSETREEVERIKEAEKFLKDNNCSLVINNKSKRINHI